MIMMFPDGPDKYSPSLLNIPVLLILLISIIYSITYGNIRTLRVTYPFFAIVIFLAYLWFDSIFLGGFPTNLTYIEYLTIISAFVFSVLITKSKYSNIYLNCILLVFIFLTCYYLQNIHQYIIEEHIAQNNAAYTLLFFLPFILCLSQKIYKRVLLFLILISLFFSLKRGTIIAFCLAYMVYYFIVNKPSITKIILILGVIICFAFVINNYFEYDDNLIYNTVIERFENLKEDGGSGRTDIYVYVWDKILNANAGNNILGYGWGSVQKTSLGLSAHNDFLEIIYDFGWFGFILYLFVLINLFILLRKVFFINRKVGGIIACSLTITLFINSISHIVLYPKCLLLSCMFWGYAIGFLQTKRLIIQ